MTKEEIKYQIGLSYEGLCKYLQEKYGIPDGDYFLDESYRSVNGKIKRGYQGLHIHHLKENGYDGKDFIVNISDPAQARHFPFDYQKAENLCYCNLLEHLILHIKITEFRMRTINKLVYDGSTLIIAKLDDIYESQGTKSESDRTYLEPIKDNYSDYIEICNILSDVAEELGLI